ncbi:MAG TPA: CRTAC1 family protein [Thermoanaerobaculia bacterium]|nr:CRTAC1 family protein [Thermoanaerobaculia bacterium]
MSNRPPHAKPAGALLAAVLLLPACGGERLESTTPDTAAAATATPPWFVDVSDEAGVDFVHSAGHGEGYLMPESMGSGLALFDHDGDGDLDLYLVDGGSGSARDRLYRQQADGTFTDVTAAAGLGRPAYGMGAAVGDVDDDGDLDLFLTRFGADALFLNAGDGTFTAAPADGGLGDDLWTTSACFFDADRDGALDLYVATYLGFDPPRSCTDRAGNPEYCGPEAYRGLPDRFYRGRGDGTFADATADWLVAPPANKGLGVVCADLDGDGRVEIYVANDGEPNQLWVERDDGRFEDRAALLGADVNGFGKPEAGMGLALGDADGDLHLDLFVTHLDRETNTLYRALGDGGFEDATASAGLGPPSLPLTGFGTTFLDADLDGDLDLALVDGRVRRGASAGERAERRQAWQVDPSVPAKLIDYAEPNLFFVNRGDGRFRDAAAEGGAFTAGAEVSRAVATGDLDGDGDLDLVVTQAGGPARLYRNQAPRDGHHWLAVRALLPAATDPTLGRDALGARVEVRAGDRAWVQPVTSTAGYLTTVEPVAWFGLGDAARVDSITVTWPGGERERFAGGEADRTVILRRGEGSAP